MKKLLLILAVLLSVNCIAQNRYEKLFVKADSAFTATQDRKVFDSTTAIITKQSDKEITVTVESLLLLYWSGYIDGSRSALEKKSFDYELFKSNITANKKSIESYIRFLKLHTKK